VRAQRRSLTKITLPSLDDDRCLLIMVLRLAILFHRNRLDDNHPELSLSRDRLGFSLEIEDTGWLKDNPLTEAELINEVAYWKDVSIPLMISE
jgi:exopolyphosphatase/guanosine-5'-triphosphate,3'-diphosphate pyrophosphatase